VTTATADIVVRRCTVQVVRHGGWSWGPQPRRLIDQVLAALPGLIAARLADLAPDGPPDAEITEPVRIVVSLPLADLLVGRLDPLRHATVPAEPLPQPPPAPALAQPQAPVRPSGPPLSERMPALHARTQPVTLAQFLARLFERGELGQFLALLPVHTLEAWYRSLTAPPAEAPGTRPGVAAFPAMPAGRLPGGAGDPVTDVPAPPPGVAAAQEAGRSRQLRDAIAAIAARASRQTQAHPLQPGDPAAGFHHRQGPGGPESAGPQPPHVGAALAAAVAAAGTAPAKGDAASGQMAAASGAVAPANAFSSPVSATGEGTAFVRGDAASGQMAAASGAVAPANAVSSPVSATVADVASALPFLLLGPLAQTGYLSALTPALQAVGLESQTAAFATALAYTVLGPPERAWRRQPKDAAAAAAFAGLDAPVPGPALTEFARAAGPALPALDAVVTGALAEGHTAGEPLVLVGAEGSADGGLLLVDREGSFPLAWTDAVAGLLPAWRMCGSPPVLVAPTAVGALRGLAAAGAAFVVATPPGRGERWRRLPPHRLWTNSDDPALARHASSYRQAIDIAAELVQALARERAAVPLAAGPALGRSLLLAAGLGLGTLAWTLWREREPSDPLLALERFADLSARVSFEPHRVRVRLPLGPRHSDLSAHGLLADVHGVPWLGDRVVEFSGG